MRALFSRNRANALSWLASNFRACGMHTSCRQKNFKENSNTLGKKQTIYNLLTCVSWRSRSSSRSSVTLSRTRVANSRIASSGKSQSSSLRAVCGEYTIMCQTALYNLFTVSSIYTALSVLLAYCNRYWQGIIKLQLLIRPGHWGIELYYKCQLSQ